MWGANSAVWWALVGLALPATISMGHAADNPLPPKLKSTIIETGPGSATGLRLSTGPQAGEPKKSEDNARVAAVTPPASKPSRKPRISDAVVARINLSTQRMSVSVHGVAKYHWKISSGRKGYITPRGRFRPTWRSKLWHSRQYNGAPMPYAVFFNRGIATHGTSAVGRLGSPASHGCIRLRTPNAKTFYQLVSRYGKSRVRIIVEGTTPQRRSRIARKSKRRYDRRRARKVRRSSRQWAVRRGVRRQIRRSAKPASSGLIFPGD